MTTQHQPLPVAGYTEQPEDKVALVNANKQLEEQILRAIDHLSQAENVDKRWLAVARTQIEQGFMALNRAVFRPQRIKFPGEDHDG